MWGFLLQFCSSQYYIALAIMHRFSNKILQYHHIQYLPKIDREAPISWKYLSIWWLFAQKEKKRDAPLVHCASSSSWSGWISRLEPFGLSKAIFLISGPSFSQWGKDAQNVRSQLGNLKKHMVIHKRNELRLCLMKEVLWSNRKSENPCSFRGNAIFKCSQ